MDDEPRAFSDEELDDALGRSLPNIPELSLRAEPFPVDVLPAPLRAFVVEVAAALACDNAMVAVPMLAALAGSIGATRRVELKAGYSEPSVLWCATIARSGSVKSPALDAALAPLRERQADYMREHAEAMAEYERERSRYEKRLREWKNDGGSGDPPIAPERPTLRRVIVSDTTTEALAVVLSENLRGVLLVRDELGGLVRSFDAYRQGRGGDEQTWLEMHRAGPINIDRKTGDRQRIHVPRGAVSIAGTLQPGVAEKVLGGAHIECGLSARMLLTQPHVPMKRWTEATAPAAVLDDYAGICGALLELGFDDNGPDETTPIMLGLTSEAHEVWTAHYEEMAQRTHFADDDAQAAAFAKLEGGAARIALVLHLARLAHDGRAGAHAPVDAVAMGAGVRLALWFANEGARFYSMLRVSDDARRLDDLVSRVRKRGGTVSVRKWMRMGSHKTADDAEAELAVLERAGLGRLDWTKPGDNGGAPSRVFRLSVGSDTDRTPDGKV